MSPSDLPIIKFEFANTKKHMQCLLSRTVRPIKQEMAQTGPHENRTLKNQIIVQKDTLVV